jgi:hypothetical protein
MKKITKFDMRQRSLAVLTAAFISLWAGAAHADADNATAIDNITVTPQVSAHEAKRIARRFLVGRGFATGRGPGKAAIESVTREGDTWVLQLAISNGGWAMNGSATLYIDAYTALLSETAPAPKPEQVVSN